MTERLEIPVVGGVCNVKLQVCASTSKSELFEVDDPYPGESRYQLVEGCTYVYEFFDDNGSLNCQFKEENEIVRFHPNKEKHKCEGTLTTGIYVGQLTLDVVNVCTGEIVGKVSLEIQSKKTDYRSDYRTMLDDIAEYYTDLVLQQGAPVTQKLEVDYDMPQQTLYQRFSFVRSVVDSDSFQEAIHKIMANPERKWTETTIKRNIVGARRLSRKNVKEIATSCDRIHLPESVRIGMPECLTSVPRQLEVDYKKDTIDNQENQFVKFALRTFSVFCFDLANMDNALGRLRAEALDVVNKINAYLDTQFFRQISTPTHLNMNSPVLQRKEGYREVLQAWLMFDLAARLNWEGGDNVYDAGKKNVATLYEYWLFLKLQELVCDFFSLDKVDKSKLVKTDANGINLDIKQGKMTMVSGVSMTGSRKLNVALYYNRTFSKPTKNKDAIHSAGSWTMAMRPDYTLSIWTGDIDEAEAERQDLITHIHFDAKYRLNKILLEDDSRSDLDDELDKEKQQQEMGMYKRADLLKMHAYKDAIRRTSGAYVLYPGTENRDVRGFHEIIPGLGAFSIRPGNWNEDSVYLRQFLAEVKAHMLDRTSEREKMSYYQNRIYEEPNATMLMESLPEPVGENRDFLPDETWVVVGYYKGERQLNWILENHMYNMRSGDDKGAISLSTEIVNARYLLLHNGEKSTRLIEIRKGGPKVYSRKQLVENHGYPPYLISGKPDKIDYDREAEASERLYVVFNLFKSNSAGKELDKYKWDMSRVFKVNDKRLMSKPKTMRLSELIGLHE